MNSEIYINISNSPAHKSSRENKSQPILINNDLFPDLLEQALNVGDENHHKACRILALVLENSSILSRIIFRYFALVFQDSLTKAPCVLFLNQLIRKPTPYFIDATRTTDY
jgi:hypothetical protein